MGKALGTNVHKLEGGRACLPLSSANRSGVFEATGGTYIEMKYSCVV